MVCLGRKSHADQVIEELEDIEDAQGHYLVMYEFERKKGNSIHTIFFTNLKRIMQKLGDGERVQYSVIECNRLKTARAIELLCKRFKARDIAIYKVDKVPLLD